MERCSSVGARADAGSVRAKADRKPERVLFLDAGFAGNDRLNANAAQMFMTMGVTSFQAV